MEGSIYKGYKKTFRRNRQVYYLNYHEGFTLDYTGQNSSNPGSLNMSNLYLNHPMHFNKKSRQPNLKDSTLNHQSV